MIYEVFKAIRTKLVNDALVVAEVGTRVYAELPDASAALPYIVMDFVGGGDANLTPTDMIDVSVQVKCIATSAATAQTVQRLIRAALHHAALTMGDGWNAYAMTHADALYMVEQAEKTQFYHAGGTYRLRASK